MQSEIPDEEGKLQRQPNSVNTAENSQYFLKMGFHCLDLIKGIYTQYNENNEILSIKQPNNIKSLCRLPNLTLIK